MCFCKTLAAKAHDGLPRRNKVSPRNDDFGACPVSQSSSRMYVFLTVALVFCSVWGDMTMTDVPF